MQLRARGFRVETVAPDQVPATPADLEVRLEECSSEDVLTRAAQVSEADDLWVFVAPGALDERARPMDAIPLLPPVVQVPRLKGMPKADDREAILPANLPFLPPEDDPILAALEACPGRVAALTARAGTPPPMGNRTLPAGDRKPRVGCWDYLRAHWGSSRGRGSP